MTDMRKQRGGGDGENGICVSILMATYNPDREWLKKQLVSINRQSFSGYEVLILDDCSEEKAYCMIRELASAILVRAEKVSVMRNERNAGSTKTFEKLVRMAAGKYTAFCDQDDIWEKEKLFRLLQVLETDHAVLAYSDMSVINENGVMVCPGMGNMRRCLDFVSGDGVAGKFLFENCAAGCSMLARTELVKKTLPFPDGIYHDQWVAACLSAYGRISFVREPLVRYRRHGGNQTGSLAGIFCKKDYYERRVLPACRMLDELSIRSIQFAGRDRAAAFAAARRERDVLRIWKYRDVSMKYAVCDILAVLLPGFIFRILLKIWRLPGRRRSNVGNGSVP